MSTERPEVQFVTMNSREPAEKVAKKEFTLFEEQPGHLVYDANLSIDRNVGYAPAWLLLLVDTGYKTEATKNNTVIAGSLSVIDQLCCLDWVQSGNRLLS